MNHVVLRLLLMVGILILSHTGASAYTFCATYQSCNPVQPRGWRNCTLLTDPGGEYFMELSVLGSDAEHTGGTFNLSYLRHNAMLMKRIASGEWTIPHPSRDDARTLMVFGLIKRKPGHRSSVFGMTTMGYWETLPLGAMVSADRLDLDFDYVFSDEKSWVLDGNC